jgi:carboxylesterase
LWAAFGTAIARFFDMANKKDNQMRYLKLFNKYRRAAMIATIVGIIAVWCGVDFTYANIVEYKLEKWEKAIVRDVSGIRDGCQEFTAGDGDTALLMVHGFGDSPQLWEYMAPHLAEKGYTCRAIRLPGFASEMAVYKTTSAEKWIKKLEDELAVLRQSHDSVFIVSHSLGGACSIKVLIDDPEAADGLVAFAPLIGVSNRRAPVLSSRRWFKVLSRIKPFSDIIASTYDPNVHNTEELKKIKVDRYTPEVVFREMFKVVEYNEIRASQLETPMMMVLSDKDMVVDSKKAAAFHAAAGSTDKELIQHHVAGHLMPRDYEWEVLAERTHAFIQRQLAAE